MTAGAATAGAATAGAATARAVGGILSCSAASAFLCALMLCARSFARWTWSLLIATVACSVDDLLGSFSLAVEMAGIPIIVPRDSTWLAGVVLGRSVGLLIEIPGIPAIVLRRLAWGALGAGGFSPPGSLSTLTDPSPMSVWRTPLPSGRLPPSGALAPRGVPLDRVPTPNEVAPPTAEASGRLMA
ncbi:MAG: hypothetical protein CO108_03740 [Deltaproteobacteria bacterium CG_4_9_14_3_um_filter_63_12]|nr:MAG: hypothetical protein CO108_03740 [Deltaproteobacteria bacterium CG_4_9_14_3_um_filter_63_12]